MHKIQVEQHDGSVTEVVINKVKSIGRQDAFEQLPHKCEQKPLTSKYVARTKRDIGPKHNHPWGRKSVLKEETEGVV